MKKYRIEWRNGGSSEYEWVSFFTLYKVMGCYESEFWGGYFPWMKKMFVDGVEIPKLKWHHY